MSITVFMFTGCRNQHHSLKVERPFVPSFPLTVQFHNNFVGFTAIGIVAAQSLFIFEVLHSLCLCLDNYKIDMRTNLATLRESDITINITSYVIFHILIKWNFRN